MATYSKNAYLTAEEQLENATYIYSFLLSKGWSKNAIFAILGNMQSESSVNPGIWEGLVQGDDRGFGLVQWTPSTNYIEWAVSQGYTTFAAYSQLEPQLLRIIYELNNGLQWITTDTYPLTFKQFSRSTLDVDYLTLAFLYNYERPGVIDEEDRQAQALEWQTKLTGITPSTPIDSKSHYFIYPVANYLKITQEYKGSTHSGIDLGHSTSYPGGNNQPIIAAQKGTVIKVTDGYGNDPNAGYGNQIIIDHGDGIYTLYAHLLAGSIMVNVGDTVVRGQHIAKMGNSGYSTAQHLHFEYRIGGNDKAHAVDPVERLVAPTTLYINPDSIQYNKIRIVDLTKVARNRRKGYNFVLFNKERRKRLWNVTM